jgi:hypothetical protein
MNDIQSNNVRKYLIASSCFFGVLVADILVAKFQVMSGAKVPVHLGDTGQFLILLISVTFFVIGALKSEKQESEQKATDSHSSGDGFTDP